MGNNNEIRERIEIVELELMSSMSLTLDALMKLRTKHYDAAKDILIQVRDQIKAINNLIPPEEGE